MNRSNLVVCLAAVLGAFFALGEWEIHRVIDHQTAVEQMTDQSDVAGNLHSERIEEGDFVTLEESAVCIPLSGKLLFYFPRLVSARSKCFLALNTFSFDHRAPTYDEAFRNRPEELRQYHAGASF
jgi:hypothetical protein